LAAKKQNKKPVTHNLMDKLTNELHKKRETKEDR
jgi:hypothetical protein